jgi:hypothetical protein
MKKQEMHADQQYLDALEIIKESMGVYLDLLTYAKQNENDDMIYRLDAKLNSNFDYYVKNWDGDIRINHTIYSTCTLAPGQKRLKI